MSAEKADHPKIAVAAILLAVLTLALGDALVKEVSATLVLWQIFVLRSVVAVLVLFLVLRLGSPDVSLVPTRVFWTMARSALLIAMWVTYYAALPHVQLSVAAAALYTLPLFITLFSALLVSERVTALGWAAVGLGFVGVLLILRPSASGFSAYAFLPLLSAVLYALAMILTRTKCRDEHPLVLSGALNVAFIVVGLAATGLISLTAPPGTASGFLSAGWPPLGGSEVLAILLLAGGILVASIGTSVAYQVAKPSMIATFDFAYVGFAVIFGYFFFDEVPDPMALSGILMITVAGLLAVRQ